MVKANVDFGLIDRVLACSSLYNANVVFFGVTVFVRLSRCVVNGDFLDATVSIGTSLYTANAGFFRTGGSNVLLFVSLFSYYIEVC